MITQEQIKSLFTYKSGILLWKIKSSSSVNIGDVAGKLDRNGYRDIGINGRCYGAHRLIFLLFNSYLPKFIDHIDGDPLNNKIKNLRKCTVSQNNQNRKINKKSKSGIKGVHWYKQTRRWRASIKLNGKEFHLGYFHDKEVAAQIVRIKRLELHGEFANHG